MELCPCGSNNQYVECCEPFIRGEKKPKTPEELMRSRYSAYNKMHLDYIAQTMRGPAASDFDPNHAEHWSSQIKWLGLQVIRSESDGKQGTVEFIIHYSHNNNKDVMYEISEFICDNGTWFYIDGATPKIGRNDTCPCGSKKKYKKCCGA